MKSRRRLQQPRKRRMEILNQHVHARLISTNPPGLARFNVGWNKKTTPIYPDLLEASIHAEIDFVRVPVSPDATTTIQGVKVYEYTRYGPGHMRFHVGPHTFDVSGSSSPLMQKTLSALVNNLALKSSGPK